MTGHLAVGGYRIDAVLDGEGQVAVADAFPDVDPGAWEPYRAMLRHDALAVAVGAFLLRGHGRIALVDLGYGPGALGGIATGRLLRSLAVLGVAAGEVTDVLFTHLHRDHVGWLSVDGRLQFPNAGVRCHPADVRHFVVEAKAADVAERLRPWQDRIEPLGDEPLPGVEAVHAPGHTPGSAMFVLAGGGRRVVVLGDVAHAPVQLLEPGWSSAYDLDAHLARRTRTAVADDLARTGALAAGMHFPAMRFGRLVEGVGGRRWDDRAGAGS